MDRDVDHDAVAAAAAAAGGEVGEVQQVAVEVAVDDDNDDDHDDDDDDNNNDDHDKADKDDDDGDLKTDDSAAGPVVEDREFADRGADDVVENRSERANLKKRKRSASGGCSKSKSSRSSANGVSRHAAKLRKSLDAEFGLRLGDKGRFASKREGDEKEEDARPVLRGNPGALHSDPVDGRNADLLQALEAVRAATEEIDVGLRKDQTRRRLVQELAYEVDRLHYEMNLPRVTAGTVNPPVGETALARTWPELLRLLDLNSWDSWRGAFQSPFVFRGLPNKSFRLKTSLQRLGHGIGSVMERETEKAILRSFRNYSHGALPAKSSLFEWLTLAQHHGCPTRMLDFSYSPLVALHFATSDPTYDDEDGVVWCVQPRKCLTASTKYAAFYQDWKKRAHDSYWSVARIDQLNSLLAFAARREAAEEPDAAHAATSEGADLDDVGSTVKTLDRLRVLGDALVFVEAPALHQRVINQNHVFAFLSDGRKTTDEWLEGHRERGTHRKIVIARHLKQEVRQRLNNFAVTERLLFPGLDGTSKWLKKFYTASKAAPASPNMFMSP